MNFIKDFLMGEEEKVKPKKEEQFSDDEDLQSDWSLVSKNNNQVVTHVEFSHTAEEESDKLQVFLDVLKEPVIDLKKLKDISRSGVPTKLRGLVWQILIGVLPLQTERHVDIQENLFQNYQRLTSRVDQFSEKKKLLSLIALDVRRTNPEG